jgi:Sulfatase
VPKRVLRFVLPILALAVAIYAISASSGDHGDQASAKAKAKRPSVVLIVMDEFPGDQLLGADGSIDAVRYPNFALLARTGTWFRNGSTTYDSTTVAVPEVLDSRLPRKVHGRGELPTYVGHPHSVYELFHRHGYRIVRSEEATSICPPRYCKGASTKRPAILPQLRKGRRARLDRFIDEVRPGRPTLYLKHVLLPHQPYEFLPSGKQTRSGPTDPVPNMNGPQGFGDPFLTDHNQQRLQLQIGYADHQLGRLFAKMRRNGTFDKSLIAVTADHGIAFEVGVKDRRKVTKGNIDEIAPVPFFIKAPGQTKGVTNSSYVRTVDLVPTIADILNFKVPYRADGRSAYSKATRRRHYMRMIKRGYNGAIKVSAKSLDRRRAALLARKIRLYGAGDIASLYTGIGPNRQLIGTSTAALHPTGLGKVRATVVGARAMRAVSARSLILPAQIAGPVKGGKAGGKRDVAVAVNGRIEAVGRTFYLRGSGQESFAMMVPERTLHSGRNSVEVYEVTAGGRGLQLIGRD